MTTPPRYLSETDPAGSLVGFPTTLLAGVLSPTFSWTAITLSDLGATDAANPRLFNVGLMAAGLVALPLAWVLFDADRHLVAALGALVYAATVADLALIGVFPSSTDLHWPLSVPFFTVVSIALWIHVTGRPSPVTRAVGSSPSGSV